MNTISDLVKYKFSVSLCKNKLYGKQCLSQNLIEMSVASSIRFAL